MYQTNHYEGMLAETVTMQGHKGDTINAYYARPLGGGPPSRNGDYPPRARMGRVVPRMCPPVRPPRIRHDFPQPLFPRRPRNAGGRRRQSARGRRRAR